MTKIDKMEQLLNDIKEQLDDLYEGQQAIKDMIREVGGMTLVDDEDDLISYYDTPSSDEFEE